MNKRILFVISSLGSGGAERVVSILANSLSKKGFDVGIVLTVSDKRVYELNDEIKLISLNCINDSALPFIKRYAIRRRKLKQAILSYKPDMVVSFLCDTNMDVCDVMRHERLPLIVSERNDPRISPAGKAKKILRRLLYRRANGFVFQTYDAQAYFSKAIQKRSCVILNPVNDKLPAPFEGERTKRIVSVGRLHKQKNFNMLINAYNIFYKEFPEYRLEIFGEGPLKDELQAEIDKRGLNGKIILKGFSNDVNNATNDASVFVLPSDFEGMPNALIEAMCMGLPCVSTDCPCGGPKMLIENMKNGILVPVNDAEAMAEALILLVRDKETAKSLGNNAFLLNEKVSVDNISEQWLGYINGFLK